MRIHNKKRRNWALFLVASVVFITLILYSNSLINNIREEERRKVNVWADAISYKANLVSNLENFFKDIRLEEGKRASLLAKAQQRLNDASLSELSNEDMIFYLEIISSNTTIPCILTDEKGNINYMVNMEGDIPDMKHINELGSRKSEYDSIKMVYLKKRYNILYHKESKIYSNLRAAIDNLLESYFQEIVTNTASAPVLVTDSTMKTIITHGTIKSSHRHQKYNDQELIKHFLTQNTPIKIELPDYGACYVLYEESPILMQLRYYPMIQLIIVLIFAAAGFLIFSFARRSEQNRVWVGMSKETAHQLGTPISSLLAWNELLNEQNVDPSIMKEIEKDVNRLETIAQRFSKIGSEPELVTENIATLIEEFVEYLQSRISSKVTIKVNRNNISDFNIPVNKYLFEWVIENLCKNSVDAMEGKGVIIIDLLEDEKNFYVDVTDTGKGIMSNEMNMIFQPGYTTKKRGWGLGLPLAKRIIKQYHKGKLFAKSSIQGRGTVMRIQLKK
jgi:signal transduction histidine kinase